MNKERAEPIYSTVNKAPTIIKSKKLAAMNSIGSIEVTNGVQIHNAFTAVSTPDTFNAIEPSYSPFPKIPEEVVARAMQRLQHNQEKCFEFLKEVLEVMTEHDCSAEIAESVSLSDFSGKKKAEAIVLIKQFNELGFSTDDIVTGLEQDPADRDALLDYLTR